MTSNSNFNNINLPLKKIMYFLYKERPLLICEFDVCHSRLKHISKLMFSLFCFWPFQCSQPHLWRQLGTPALHSFSCILHTPLAETLNVYALSCSLGIPQPVWPQAPRRHPKVLRKEPLQRTDAQSLGFCCCQVALCVRDILYVCVCSCCWALHMLSAYSITVPLL